MDRLGLHVGWCNITAAKYACRKWHYSRTTPCFKTNSFGVWYDGEFVGSIIYGLGGGRITDGTKYGLRKHFDMAELCRVALTSHTFQTSQAISYSIRLLKKKNPNLKMLISFADASQGHHGGIYQAGGWIYTGMFKGQDEVVVNGQSYHPRSAQAKFGNTSIAYLRSIDPNACKKVGAGKHRYLMPLTKQLKKRIVQLSKPYPKRVSSDTSDTPAFHAGKAGATPSDALQKGGD